MLPMHDTTNIADRLRALADDIENDDADDDFPAFDGFQMVREYPDALLTGNVYRDEDGDVWIHTEKDVPYLCLGTMTDSFIEAVEDAAHGE